ncbi:hypothetical protein [Streptomyces scopuliridis]|uniref:Uncharacterized protein n=1 Tax=Streptomyces scopuliridis TaxID=452529 RepID=A0ACD4ZSR2_9ACTN|nr:hypothetical protein [Streptomyces scopuliridis]WSC00112.1 hypothetical protein OG835_26010 [Streptomyces scopuliridis]
MTGPEHYREAEQLLTGDDVPADNELGIEAHHIPPSQMDLLAAQVHATLALTAATVEQASNAAIAADINSEDLDSWHRVTHRPQGGDAL